MTIAELAKIISDLSAQVSTFVAAQAHYNELACKHEADLRGNGKEGIFTVLAKIDGRIYRMEEADSRRKKLVDGLVGAFLLMAVIEIVRLIAAAL